MFRARVPPVATDISHQRRGRNRQRRDGAGVVRQELFWVAYTASLAGGPILREPNNRQGMEA
jgi:hypothetical protein